MFSPALCSQMLGSELSKCSSPIEVPGLCWGMQNQWPLSSPTSGRIQFQMEGLETGSLADLGDRWECWSQLGGKRDQWGVKMDGQRANHAVWVQQCPSGLNHLINKSFAIAWLHITWIIQRSGGSWICKPVGAFWVSSRTHHQKPAPSPQNTSVAASETHQLRPYFLLGPVRGPLAKHLGTVMVPKCGTPLLQVAWSSLHGRLCVSASYCPFFSVSFVSHLVTSSHLFSFPFVPRPHFLIIFSLSICFPSRCTWCASKTHLQDAPYFS